MSIRIALAAGLAAAGIAATATPALAAPPSHSCFFISQWHSWKSPSPNVLYLGVNGHDVYRVDLSIGSPDLQQGNMHLVSEFRGSSSVCDALDLDLKLSDGHGFSEPLLAKSLIKLSPEEVAAIPAKFRPN